MPRSTELQEILDLEIYDSVLISPKKDETVQRALQRLKLRTSKYRKYEKSFVVEAASDRIRVTRIPFGTSKRFWRWLRMGLGEIMILEEEPTLKDSLAAYHAAEYFNGACDLAGNWRTGLDAMGRLYVKRLMLEDGQNIYEQHRPAPDEKREEAVPYYVELEREAGRWQHSADLSRSQANRGKGEPDPHLMNVVRNFEERAKNALAKAKELREAEAAAGDALPNLVTMNSI